jgi:hypothetical protein
MAVTKLAVAEKHMVPLRVVRGPIGDGQALRNEGWQTFEKAKARCMDVCGTRPGAQIARRFILPPAGLTDGFFAQQNDLEEFALEHLSRPKSFWHPEITQAGPMSWSELERFEAEAEAIPSLRHQLKGFRSQQQLTLAAWRLGSRITRRGP